MRLPRTIAPLLALVLVGGAAAGARGAVFGGTPEEVRVSANGSMAALLLSCEGGRLANLRDPAAVPGAGPECGPIRKIVVDGTRMPSPIILEPLRAGQLPQLATVETTAGQDQERFVGSFAKDEVLGPFTYAEGGGGNDVLVRVLNAWGQGGHDWIHTHYSAWRRNGNLLDLRLARVDGGEGNDVWKALIDEMGDGTTLTLDSQSLRLNDGSQINPTVVNIEAALLTLVGSGHVFDGSAFPGALQVEAGPGSTLIGGARADTLTTVEGNDVITGGGGADTIQAGAGDDVVHGRDGVVDTVDCGAGNDVAHVDPEDSVVNCESVQGPPTLVAPTNTGVVTGTTLGTPAVAPDTGAIAGPRKVRKPQRAKFTFGASVPGATFMCKLDRAEWRGCATPHVVATKKLKRGKHRLRVWAVVGNQVDTTPSVHTFKVKAKKAGKKSGTKKGGRKRR